ncbi:nucleotidyltransferase family protein [Flavobacteriaceae bacterium]|nr:nucleotidyltransferase family protein [Flavobacteriaceae bacterium]
MIALEEKFLVNILYRPESEILNDVDINNINFEKLITLASGHLMLPALFFNIQKKKASYLFPEDFIAYVKSIYAINKARNEILLEEAKELSELLVENNIKHIFLKGTALLLSNVFEDIGERMIGDIDFIIQGKDEEKIKKVLEKNKYYSKKPFSSFRFFKPKHLPRRINKNKKIAIEPHLELLSPGWRGVFNSKRLSSAFKENVKAIKTPNQSFLFDHCIYAFQIPDKGFFTSFHSHRSIYDIYKLDCKKNVTIKNTTKDIYFKHFFMTIEKFKIFDLQLPSSFWSIYHNKCLRILMFIFIKILTIISKCSILIQLLCNNELRKRALNKIRIHYHHKSLLNYTYRWLIG